MKRAFDRARDDRPLGVVDRGVVDDAMAQERPVLHQPKHGVFPWFLLMASERVAQPTICNRVGSAASATPPSAWRTRAPRLPACRGRATGEYGHPAGGSAKSPEGKPSDVMGRRTGGGEVAQNLADHRRELEAMTGAGRSDDDIGGAGQAIDDEIAVGSHGVEAGFGGDEPAVRRRDMFGHGGADQCLVRRRHRSVVGVGVDRFVAMVVLGNFDATVDACLGWNAVMHAMPALDDEYWSATARK